MLKKTCVALAFFISACVTVNIYFPAAAVQRAADKIVEETWGGSGNGQQPPAPQSGISRRGGALARLSLVATAHAQDADINISNPAIRAIKESIRVRSDAIKPFMDRGNIGIQNDGLLNLRNTDGLNLKERAETQQLVDAENRDREKLYAEIAKANGFPSEAVPRIKRIFAKSWLDQAKAGWWVQEEQGAWRKK